MATTIYSRPSVYSCELWLRAADWVPAEITLLESQVRALQAAKAAEEEAAAASASASKDGADGSGKEGKEGKGSSWWPWK